MISAILAIIIVNLGYKLIMKIIGADVMFFSWKTKVALYCLVGIALFSVIGI